MFPDLSDAKYRILCSPTENVFPGCFPNCVMFGTRPELSVHVGWTQVTWADVSPLSAVMTMLAGQSAKTGAETSEKQLKIKHKQI